MSDTPPKPRILSRGAFRADPDRYLACAEAGEVIQIVDEQGQVRMILSAPLAPPPDLEPPQVERLERLEARLTELRSEIKGLHQKVWELDRRTMGLVPCK